MNVVAIVAEFNPFHNGHKFLIEEAKRITNSDFVICIMSGSFTQAGNIAIYDKFYRANSAIENGADLVIELPTIYATASSQLFSYGAIQILNKLNVVSHICFGSESGDIEIIDNIAKKTIKNDEMIWKEISSELKSGISFAQAREHVLKNILDEHEFNIFSKSNNILGIEYVKSLKILNSDIVPICIKRTENNTTISATKIREMISNNIDINDFIPINNIDNDNKSLFNDHIFDLLKYEILNNGISNLANINGVVEGLENKIFNSIKEAKNYDELINLIKSKRYQMSKIKRILLAILLNITKEKFDRLYNNNVAYAHILACSNNGKKLFSDISKSQIPLITSINEELLDSLEPLIKESVELDIHASNIHSILTNTKINKDYTNKL